jgi:hypothetical protein
MKKFLVAAWFVLTLASAFLPGPVLADSDDPRTFVLSNERGPANEGGLIDMLIAAGHGSDNLYQVLQLLAADPASGIPADFVASVGNNPPGSEVFTAPLSNFGGLIYNPLCINADGNLTINAIYGRDYDGHTGFVTNKIHYPGIALANFTLAESSTYYIDAGSSGGPSPIYYKAIGIAYANAWRSFVISNEAPGYLIDKLIAAGHGSDKLYQVLQFLAAQAGSGIPSDFVTEVGNNLPGSEVFTAALSNFAGLNNPVCINADGTLTINGIFGREYDGEVGYVTNQVHYTGVALANFTMATAPIYYIDAGSSGGPSPINYQAIGIAWAGAAAPASIPTLNEWGMILMVLFVAGVALVYMKRRRWDILK